MVVLGDVMHVPQSLPVSPLFNSVIKETGGRSSLKTYESLDYIPPCCVPIEKSHFSKQHIIKDEFDIKNC